jgi:hypothetical protein
MRTGMTFLSVTISVVVLSSCTQTTAPRIDNPHGVFHGSVVLYDSTGGNPIDGTLSLSRGDSSELSGTWNLGNGQSGRLNGTMTDSTLWMDLNPDLVDANTVLWGTFDGISIRGQWTFSGVMGPINHGTFVAMSN